jgi:spermidine/putrescine transport system permease protein
VSRISWPLWLASVGVYFFLYVPLLVVVVYSFNDSRLNAEWVGFTWHWYGLLFEDADMLKAAANSMIIGLATAFFSTILGTLAGLALHRTPRKLLLFLILAPVAIPEILMGVGLLLFFVLLDFTLGMTSIILAHIAFCISFVAIVVRARLSQMDDNLVEAARDLGASPWQALGLIILPLAMPGIVAGALMAFTLSIDDFVITFFTAGAGTSTLPLEIYSMIKVSVTPEINAVSTLLMLFTLMLMALAAKLASGILRIR